MLRVISMLRQKQCANLITSKIPLTGGPLKVFSFETIHKLNKRGFHRKDHDILLIFVKLARLYQKLFTLQVKHFCLKE